MRQRTDATDDTKVVTINLEDKWRSNCIIDRKRNYI